MYLLVLLCNSCDPSGCKCGLNLIITSAGYGEPARGSAADSRSDDDAGDAESSSSS